MQVQLQHPTMVAALLLLLQQQLVCQVLRLQTQQLYPLVTSLALHLRLT
jgi:hypothetical protein